MTFRTEDFTQLQDVAFNLLVYDKASKGVYVPRAAYYYRINRESVTHRYQADIIGKFDIINRWFGEFAEKKEDPRFLKAYHERVVTHLRTCLILHSLYSLFFIIQFKNTSSDRRSLDLHIS